LYYVLDRITLEESINNKMNKQIITKEYDYLRDYEEYVMNGEVK